MLLYCRWESSLNNGSNNTFIYFYSRLGSLLTGLLSSTSNLPSTSPFFNAIASSVGDTSYFPVNAYGNCNSAIKLNSELIPSTTALQSPSSSTSSGVPSFGNPFQIHNIFRGATTTPSTSSSLNLNSNNNNTSKNQIVNNIIIHNRDSFEESVDQSSLPNTAIRCSFCEQSFPDQLR